MDSTSPKVTVDVAVSVQLPLVMLLLGPLELLEPLPQPMHSRQLTNRTIPAFTSFSIRNLTSSNPATKFRWY